MENWTSMQIAQKSVSKSIQNECAADTTGGVQKGLGMLPQQAIYEDWPRGEIKKMSKPVQVCPACGFVRLIKLSHNANTFQRYYLSKGKHVLNNKNIVIAHFFIEFVFMNWYNLN